jgi:hypothetical protein
LGVVGKCIFGIFCEGLTRVFVPVAERVAIVDPVLRGAKLVAGEQRAG